MNNGPLPACHDRLTLAQFRHHRA